ncbi:hypothetical protein C2G38_2091519 [Gigaspora rosea]|uniref:Uncharacterized protein n=1 Tax=Gigaspora rosea TaxID=44941 RepID=A0A397V4C8_9GLOM|nr:hypothetical protein C2G38_2091519 [Gigaspora rosea]
MESQYSFQRAKYRRQQKISKLSPLDEVSENFPDQPSQKNIYLIIQQGVNREDSSVYLHFFPVRCSFCLMRVAHD